MIRHTQFGKLMAVAWISAFATGAAEGAVVTSPADSGPGTLREAMAAAATGDTITFAPGVTSIALTSGELSFGGKALTIDGGGNVMIDAGGASRIFNVSGNYTVSAVKGLTLVNGSSTANGGGIVFVNGSDSVLIVSNCTISACSALNGGGIYADIGNNAPARRLIVEDCLVTGNEATTGNGGGIFSYSVLELRGAVVSNNTATANSGGGVYLWASAAPSLWDDVTLVDNAATNAGAVYLRATPFRIDNSTFHTNVASSTGGAIRFEYYSIGAGLTPDDLVFSNCTFSANGAGGGGGAVTITYGTPAFVDCTFTGNTAVGSGGAVALGLGGSASWQTSECLLRGCALSGNTAGAGGAVSTGFRGTLTTLEDCDLYDNVSTGTSGINGGGAVYAPANDSTADARTVLVGCRVFNNSAARNGGGINAQQTLVVLDTLVSNNTATGVGGGVYAYMPSKDRFSDCAIAGSLFVDNAAGGGDGGGGICWRGDKLVLSETRFRGNVAIANSDALQFFSYETPFMTVSNCTFEGRTGGQRLARFQGPALLYGCTFNSHTGAVAAVGIENALGPTSRVVNCTFTGLENTAGHGGALAASGTGALEVFNTTISGNKCAYYGGGIYVGKADTSLYSTIIAGNEGAAAYKDIWVNSVTMSTLDHCIYQVLNGSVATSTGNLVGDPKLEPLADNGGPTRTLAIQPTSPCRDAGANPLGLAFDQRGAGYARTFNLIADIGAYEFIPPPPVGSVVVVR